MEKSKNAGSKEAAGGGVTDWYPPEIEPVHEGVYERNEDGSLRYSCWMYGRWSTSSPWPEFALKQRWGASNRQYLPWRGRSKP